MKAELQNEHRWLEQLVGTWVTIHETPEMDGNPASSVEWTETIRSLNGAWLVFEASGPMGPGETGASVMTLGYDPAKQRYIGNWVGTMMTHMWVYSGSVDASGKVLTLDCEGPDFEDPSKTLKYQDIHTIKSKDVRNLTSRCQQADGSWQEVMTMDYHRKK
ncbi:DUF1579 domain-containing protein [Lacibacterium aquatile]|uniref:DUF1579 domain-containing protein n=1 Tax=Lacibacterium aquatile TaxID=1168082 RepID=A0ABW5DT83_9PROT